MREDGAEDNKRCALYQMLLRVRTIWASLLNLLSSTVASRLKTVATLLPAVDLTLLVLNIAGACRLLTLALMGNGRGLGVRAVVRLAVVGIFRLSGGSSGQRVIVELPSNTEEARQQQYPRDPKCSRRDEVATI